jgi:hypothetical protein
MTDEILKQIKLIYDNKFNMYKSTIDDIDDDVNIDNNVDEIRDKAFNQFLLKTGLSKYAVDADVSTVSDVIGKLMVYDNELGQKVKLCDKIATETINEIGKNHIVVSKKMSQFYANSMF